MKLSVIKKEPERKLVAVCFQDGIYKEYNGCIHVFTLQKNPYATGFQSLEQILHSRCGAVPVYEGDSVSIQF